MTPTVWRKPERTWLIPWRILTRYVPSVPRTGRLWTANGRITDVLVDTLCPADETQDAEVSRNPAARALSDIVDQGNHVFELPGPDRLGCAGASRNELSDRIALAVGTAVLDKAASAKIGQQRLEEMQAYIREERLISQNVPLTPMRAGSLSTRTTHPFYFRELQTVLDAAALRTRIVNPFSLTRLMHRDDVLGLAIVA
jgi:hypothetical protein